MALNNRFVGSLAVMTLLMGLSDSAQAQGLGNPRRIDSGPSGALLVSDRSGLIVSVDAQTLEPHWTFQLPDEGAAYGLAVLDKLVLVGNTETSNVEAYMRTNRFADGFESGGSGQTGDDPHLVFQFNLGGVPPGSNGTIAKPIGVAASVSSQRILVLDAAAKRVKAYDAQGAFLYEFPPADGDGDVLSPVSIAVSAAGDEIWIGDYGDPAGTSSPSSPPRILIYDLLGNLLDQIDGSGFFGSNFLFARVQGLAAGSGNRIYAADPLAGRVMVFDRATGVLLDSLGAQGSAPGELMVPTDVYLNPQTGDLFIVNNRGARRVEVMRAVEVPP